MEFKYEKAKNVTVREGISFYKQDEEGEVTESNYIQAGTTGEVIGMGSSNTGDSAAQYEVLLETAEGQVEMSVAESNMEAYFVIQY